jgi:hypothetical protein
MWHGEASLGGSRLCRPSLSVLSPETRVHLPRPLNEMGQEALPCGRRYGQPMHAFPVVDSCMHGYSAAMALGFRDFGICPG